MDDQLDNDLKKRIRDVFDNYDDEHADEGWLLLREKFPEQAKRRPAAWLWWSGSAAALLLLFAGIFLFSRHTKEQNLASVKKGPVVTRPLQKPSSANNPNEEQDTAKADSVIKSLQSQYLADNKKNHIKTHNTTTIKPGNASFTHPNIPTHKLPGVPNDNLTDATKMRGISNDHLADSNNARQDEKLIAAVPPPAENHQLITKNKNSSITKPDSGIKMSRQPMAGNQQSNGVDMLAQTKKTNKTLFADDEVSANKTREKPESTGKAVRFGVYAATYFNYAKGSNNQMNVGAGVSSDIKLNKNLNLSTGVSIAQNTFAFGDQLPPASGKILTAAAPVTNLAYAQIAFSAAYPSLKNYNANLVGLDVPLNLKYQFNPEKNNTFISFGVSSGTFINETYTATYNYQTPFASAQSETTDQSIKQSFNSFYFAKTLNFSFGTGYRIGGNDLIIEPFVKYPLEGLGSQQIKFGAGGLNLKFNFQGRRK